MLDPRYHWFQITFKRTKEGEQPATFVFRGFTAAERRRAGTKKTPLETDITLLSSCVENFDESQIEFSVADRILLEIYRVSGWTEEGFPYAAAQRWFMDDDGFTEAQTVITIPGVTLDVLDNADPFDRARYLLLGQWVFEHIWGLKRGNGKDDGQMNLSALEAKAKAGAEKNTAQNLTNNYREQDGYQYKRQAGQETVMPEELPPELYQAVKDSLEAAKRIR